MPEHPHYARALFLFHLKVGARVALRTVAPVVGFFLFLYYLLRPEFAVFFFRVLIFENGLLISGLTLALTALLTARVTASRVLVGTAGWLRHLPLSSSGQRRLAVVSATVACLPVLVILAYLTERAGRLAGRPVVWYLVGLPLLGLSACLFWTPVKNGAWTRPLAFLACCLFGTGQGVLGAAGLLSLVTADGLAGPLRPRGRVHLFVPYGEKPGLAVLISIRAVGWKFAPLYLLSFVLLILSRLFVLNNRLADSLASAAIRFGGTASIVLFLALLASVLSTRRPPWPWYRSLAISAQRRILEDAVFLGVPCLSLAAVVFSLNGYAGVPVLLGLPLLAIRAAAHMRRSPELRIGPGWAVVTEGGLAALALALWPWLSLASLAGVPWFLAAAARQEQRVKASRWSELHHLAAGDSQSWSAL